jgi:sialate O-acetylesterase
MPCFGRLIFLLAIAVVSLAPCSAWAQDAEPTKPAVTLRAQCGEPFRDNAIIQQLMPVPVWGTSLPGADVVVAFDEQTKQTKADAQGRWRVVLDPMMATKLKSVHHKPEGRSLKVTCQLNGRREAVRIDNVVVGEVWIAAGQSNMAGKMRTNKSRHYPADSIEQADYPAFRQFSSGSGAAWLVCSPQTAPEFKKVCFFFGRRVQQDALVPIGIIHAAVGGSNIEPWLPGRSNPPGKYYKKFIEPVAGYGIRGAIWYQGESNAKDGRAYGPKLRALIEGWRKAWNQPDAKTPQGPRGAFSFYFVQLPGIGRSPTDNPAQGDGRAEIRQAQFETLSLPNTGMAVTLDIGDVREHPPNKYDTGVRLGRIALHRDYAMKDLTPTGPLYKRHKIDGRKVIIEFDNPGAGLVIAQKQGFEPPVPMPTAELGWLSIQDAQGEWHWADGRIDGSKLIVTSVDVSRPAAVRYAYTNHPIGPLLYNREGLPAGPFTTCGYDTPAEPDE